MIIDIHTHTFPEKIAASAIEKMEDDIERGQGFRIKAPRVATLDGLIRSTQDAGIDLSVICPVATNTQQPEKINRLAVQINERMNEDHVFSFGAIHPQCHNYKDIIRDIKSMGLKAIKLHPDYQNTFFDDEKYIRIMDYAAEKGLGIIVHAGEDVGLPDTIHCTPESVLNVLKHIQPEKLILAHMGGWRIWDQVEEKLIGAPVYMDIAVCLNRKFPVRIDDRQFVRMVRNHGTDKILFGTDSPWYDQKQALEDFENTDLNDNEKNMILGENANRLFHFL